MKFELHIDIKNSWNQSYFHAKNIKVKKANNYGHYKIHAQ